MSRLDFVRRRGLYLVGAFLTLDAAGAAAMAACSTSSPEGASGDASTDGGSPVDGARDGGGPPGDGGADTGPVGNCSPANTKCDLVLQNCPAQQECVTRNGGTECRAVQSSQQLGMGRACCPGTAQNPCLPGLSCVGQECSDGGPKTGRCTPACCKGNDQACGKSDPEGISGACDLTIVDDTQKPLHDVCTYRQRCKPFKVEPCPVGDICIVEDKAGTAACVSPFQGTGKNNREACSLANDCADGLTCVTSGDGGICRTVCLLPGATHPFDAGVEQGGPGRGGCPAPEICNTRISDTPDWFAVCSLDGG